MDALNLQFDLSNKGYENILKLCTEKREKTDGHVSLMKSMADMCFIQGNIWCLCLSASVSKDDSLYDQAINLAGVFTEMIEKFSSAAASIKEDETSLWKYVAEITKCWLEFKGFWTKSNCLMLKNVSFADVEGSFLLENSDESNDTKKEAAPLSCIIPEKKETGSDHHNSCTTSGLLSVNDSLPMKDHDVQLRKNSALLKRSQYKDIAEIRDRYDEILRKLNLVERQVQIIYSSSPTDICVEEAQSKINKLESRIRLLEEEIVKFQEEQRKWKDCPLEFLPQEKINVHGKMELRHVVKYYFNDPLVRIENVIGDDGVVVKTTKMAAEYLLVQLKKEINHQSFEGFLYEKFGSSVIFSLESVSRPSNLYALHIAVPPPRDIPPIVDVNHHELLNSFDIVLKALNESNDFVEVCHPDAIMQGICCDLSSHATNTTIVTTNPDGNNSPS